MEERKDELKKALGIKEPEEVLKEKIGEEVEKERKLGEKKGKWRFSFGRYKWGFWLLVGAFVLFLITQFIIRPLLTGG